VDFDDSGNPYNGFANGFIQAMSGFVKLKKYALGFSVRQRAYGFGINGDPDLGYYAYQRLNIDSTVNLTNAHLAAMDWTELSFYISKQIKLQNGNSFDLGISPKILMSKRGGFAKIEQSPQISRQTGNALQVEQGQLTMGLKGIDSLNSNSNIGFAVDLGFQVNLNNSDKRTILGISLLDLGFIRYKGSSQKVDINYENINQILQDSSISYSSPSILFNEIVSAAENTNNPIITNEAFTMFLPLSFSVQLDHQISKYVFVNALAVQNISFTKNQIRRSNILAFTPRFEKRWFNVMLPLTITNYNALGIGASSRLGPLTIGTENIGSALFKQRQF
ncbi:MAG: DUF5723 family protein, partial [Bacteroidota bacterium]